MMKIGLLLETSVLLFGILLGCDTNENEPTDSDTNTTDEMCEQVSETLTFDAAYNYSFKSSVDIEVVELQEYPNIPYIDWSGLTKDIKGHELALEDIGYVAIIVWNIKDYGIFENWLDEDELDMEKLEAPVWVNPPDMEPGTTGAYISDFRSDSFDPDAEEFFKVDGKFPVSDYIFVVVAGKGRALGSNAVAAAFIRPVQDETAALDLALHDNSVEFTYEAKFNNKSYVLPRNTAALTMDWTEMLGHDNALGKEFTPNQAGLIMLTFYKNKTMTELLRNFLDLEIVADRKYTYEPPDPSPVAMSVLTDEDGNGFEGLGDEEGTWLISLWCESGCNNPAPKFLTSITPCP